MKVIIGQFYRHIKSGGIYCVTDIANAQTEKWQTMVVYVADDRKVYARPIQEFVQKFKTYGDAL